MLHGLSNIRKLCSYSSPNGPEHEIVDLYKIAIDIPIAIMYISVVNPKKLFFHTRGLSVNLF